MRRIPYYTGLKIHARNSDRLMKYAPTSVEDRKRIEAAGILQEGESLAGTRTYPRFKLAMIQANTSLIAAILFK